jgi:hypothetical protein
MPTFPAPEDNRGTFWHPSGVREGDARKLDRAFGFRRRSQSG